MLRWLLPAAVATTLAFAPAANGQAFSITGGASAPVGRLGDAADLGYHIGAGINFGGTFLPVGVRLEGAYEGLGFKSSNADLRIITGTVNAIINVGSTREAPYLIAGIGAYNRNVTTNTLGYGDGRTVVGINGGGGLRFPLSGLLTFFEARYNIMLGNTADGTNYQFIPITFGIAF